VGFDIRKGTEGHRSTRVIAINKVHPTIVGTVAREDSHANPLSDVPFIADAKADDLSLSIVGRKIKEHELHAP
jgi:hypothetical protein